MTELVDSGSERKIPLSLNAIWAEMICLRNDMRQYFNIQNEELPKTLAVMR